MKCFQFESFWTKLFLNFYPSPYLHRFDYLEYSRSKLIRGCSYMVSPISFLLCGSNQHISSVTHMIQILWGQKKRIMMAVTNLGAHCEDSRVFGL